MNLQIPLQSGKYGLGSDDSKPGLHVHPSEILKSRVLSRYGSLHLLWFPLDAPTIICETAMSSMSSPNSRSTRLHSLHRAALIFRSLSDGICMYPGFFSISSNEILEQVGQRLCVFGSPCSSGRGIGRGNRPARSARSLLDGVVVDWSSPIESMRAC